MRTPSTSVVIPTLNEAHNLAPLLRKLGTVLDVADTEFVIVDDDSADGTADVASALERHYPSLVVHRRLKDHGLASAICFGITKARGHVVVVMDADLQHDERIIPELLRRLGDSDIAVGSRYAPGGDAHDWPRLRRFASRAAAWSTSRILKLRVQDPLAGFFAVRRSLFLRVASHVDGKGWKVLLDVLCRCPSARVAEVPYAFRPRFRGRTKMSTRVAWAWVLQVIRLRRHRGHLPRVNADVVTEAAS